MSNIEVVVKPEEEAVDLLPHQILIQTFKDLKRSDKVAIFTQDNPDPDAIGSAFGLSWFMKKVNPGVSTHIIYARGNFPPSEQNVREFAEHQHEAGG